MPARIKCTKCGRETTARIVEDSPDINYMEVEDCPDWHDDDHEEPTTCEHDDFEIVEIYDDYQD